MLPPLFLSQNRQCEWNEKSENWVKNYEKEEHTGEPLTFQMTIFPAEVHRKRQLFF